ncbi:MAG TPA: hypothetical protein VH814_00465 [Steroidobacteraceae bacterium]
MKLGSVFGSTKQRTLQVSTADGWKALPSMQPLYSGAGPVYTGQKKQG